jgi:putative transposase
MSRIFSPARSRRLRMKKSRGAEAQIMGVLRQATGGVPVAELCREHGMSSASLL